MPAPFENPTAYALDVSIKVEVANWSIIKSTYSTSSAVVGSDPKFQNPPLLPLFECPLGKIPINSSEFISSVMLLFCKKICPEPPAP